MQNNQLLRSGETIIRVLDIKDGQAFIVDCKRQTVPKWVNIDTLTEYETCTDDVIDSLPDINDLDLQSRKFAYEHFTYIAGVLPFVTDKKRRCEAITQITEEKRISKQTVYNYLWLYLVHQNIAALSPKTATIEKSLTDDEKNIRWALNKFFYTQNKNSLNTAYTLMLGVFIILFGIASFASIIFLISGIQEKNTAISDLEIAKRNIEDYEKNLDKRLKAIAAQGQAQAAQNAAKHPTCPICGSHNTECISTLNRTVSIATVGLASSKIGKQYQCKNCKHKW